MPLEELKTKGGMKCARASTSRSLGDLCNPFVSDGVCVRRRLLPSGCYYESAGRAKDCYAKDSRWRRRLHTSRLVR